MGKKKATPEAGKKCEEPGCITILSLYNKGNRCFHHRRIGEEKYSGLPMYHDIGASVDRFFNLVVKLYEGRWPY